MAIFPDVAERLKQLDSVMDSYFRRDPVEECNAAISRAADEFNQWAEATSAELAAAAQELDRQLEPMQDLERQVESLDQHLEAQKPEPRDAASVEHYNRLVAERNRLVQSHRELAQAYKRNGEAHNERVRARNEEFARRKKDAEEAQEAARARFEQYRSWVESRGDERFAGDLNCLYASLHQQARGAPRGTGELWGPIAKLRAMRSELAGFVRRRQEEAEHGVLVVAAVLAATEEAYMVLDTAAQLVAVTPELVEVLGLSDRTGEEVEVTLAGGIRTKGPKIVLPSVSVQGMTAEDVEAVVLRSSQAGVDGLLGLSFLNRFNYDVIRDKPQKLRLARRGQAFEEPAADDRAYDVFVCHKSEDEWWAHVVFDALTVMGYRPFLSEVSLRESGDAEFRRPIDSALASATHLVIVATSAANIEASWVQAEWGLFLTQKRAGKKTGNIITVVCGGMSAEDLPMPLSAYQAVLISERNWRETLKDFLPRR